MPWRAERAACRGCRGRVPGHLAARTASPAAPLRGGGRIGRDYQCLYETSDQVEWRSSLGVKGGIVSRARLHSVLRGSASALALLTAVSPLLGSLHEAAVRHLACPEDGELIDAPPQARHHRAPASRPAARQESTDSPAF